MRILVGELPQIAHEAREHPGQGRTEHAGPPQVVAQTELVDETGEQVEVAIRQLVATHLFQRVVHRFEEADEHALTSEVVRGGRLECFAALYRVADDVHAVPVRRAWGQRRLEGAIQFAEDVLREAFIVLVQGQLDERQPDFPPSLRPHADEPPRASLQLPSEGTMLEGGEEGVDFSQVRALAGHSLFDRFDDGREAALEVKRRKCDSKSL